MINRSLFFYDRQHNLVKIHVSLIWTDKLICSHSSDFSVQIFINFNLPVHCPRRQFYTEQFIVLLCEFICRHSRGQITCPEIIDTALYYMYHHRPCQHQLLLKQEITGHYIVHCNTETGQTTRSYKFCFVCKQNSKLVNCYFKTKQWKEKRCSLTKNIMVFGKYILTNYESVFD